MAVQGLKRRLKLDRDTERVEFASLPAALPRHLRPDVVPEVAEQRHVGAGDVVGHGDARELHDAALDGVHEREVAHRPREQRPLGVAGATEEERSRRQVDDAPQAKLPVHGFQAVDPEPCRLAVLLRLPPVVARELALIVLVGLLPVAVMRLVVEGHDAAHAHEFGHDPLEHLAFGLDRLDLRPAALEQRAAALRQFERLAQLEGVVVGDDDPRLLEVLQHVARHELTALVVALGVVRLQHAQPVADGQAGRDHEKASREVPARRPPHGVDRLPGDEHRHHRRLAGAGRQLQRQPREIGVRLLVHVVEPLEDLAHLAAATLRRDLGQPDRRLDGLDLAEERADVAEVVLAPVLQQARRLGRNVPLRLGRGSPDVYLPSQHVDGRRRVVLLLFGGEPLPFVDDHRCLLSPAALLPWTRHGRDVGRRASLFEEPVRGLALVVELPVARRVLVRRVENRGFEEAVRHGRSLSAASVPGRSGADREVHSPFLALSRPARSGRSTSSAGSQSQRRSCRTRDGRVLR